jgi:hypothetical protein
MGLGHNRGSSGKLKGIGDHKNGAAEVAVVNYWMTFEHYLTYQLDYGKEWCGSFLVSLFAGRDEAPNR